MRPAAGLRGGMLHTHVERGSSNREAPTLATQVLLARFVQRESKSSRKIPTGTKTHTAALGGAAKGDHGLAVLRGSDPQVAAKTPQDGHYSL